MKKIIFVCGPLCSGKSTVAKEIAKDLNYEFIETSDIVRKLLKENERSKMSGHPELLADILSAIKDLYQSDISGLIISGPRQIEILTEFPEAECVWVEVDEEERLERYMSRKDSKDILTKEAFYLSQQQDDELGLIEIKDYCENKLTLKTITDKWQN